MKKLILYFGIILIFIISAIGCSEVKEDISATAPNISIHKAGILDPKSKNFHGALVKELSGNLSSCSQCHAANFSGGTTGQSCEGCHATIAIHKDGIKDPGSVNFHGKYIASIGWNLSSCKSCHGATFAGGKTSPTCKTCHSSAEGPEACNTCHGDFSNPSQIAPPKDLAGNSSTTANGVGAHTTHLTASALTYTYSCSSCHPMSSSPDFVANHVGFLPADVEFDSLASLSSTPSYDFNIYTCANVYCHGNFEFSKATSSYAFVYTADKMEGNKFSPTWNRVDGTQAKCGTCHGELDANGNLVTAVPKGHIASAITGCVNCHTGIIDNQGNITEAGKSKHINGKKNVFGS
jgi:predicted CxxxxCH...CXXCH cytochrome family protein